MLCLLVVVKRELRRLLVFIISVHVREPCTHARRRVLSKKTSKVRNSPVFFIFGDLAEWLVERQ